MPHSKLTTIYNDIEEATDLPELLLKQIEHYFENYKDLEAGKWVKISGWGPKADAHAEILSSRERYVQDEA